MNTNTFKRGDVVSLKAGGPLMNVVHGHSSRNLYDLGYFDVNDDYIEISKVHSDCLVKK